MNNKRFNNAANTKLNNNADNWSEFQTNSIQHQQNKKQSNSKYQPMKQNRYFNNKNGNSHNNNYNNSNAKLNEELNGVVAYEQNNQGKFQENNGNEYEQQQLAETTNYEQNELVATVPVNCQTTGLNEAQMYTSCVPSLPVDHEATNTLPNDDSILISRVGQYGDLNGSNVSSSNVTSENTNTDECTINQDNSVDQQPIQYSYPTPSYAYTSNPQMVEIPQQQIDNPYTGATYEYDYPPMNVSTGLIGHPQMIQPQGAASPYYVYHHSYPEYSAPNATPSPMSQASPVSVNSPVTTNNIQQATYYNPTGYSTVPSYIYDPNIAGNNSYGYSPMPHQQTMLSSPQHQSILNTYQTTPPPQQNQLYMTTTPSSMSPPISISPNDTSANSSSSTIANERNSNCNSPQISSMNTLIQNQPSTPSTAMSPSQQLNPYMVYSSPNPYLTPQAYQCQSPMQTPAYIMYQAPPNYPPQQSIPASMPTPVTPHNYNSYNHKNNHHNKYRTNNRYNNNYHHKNNRYNNNANNFINQSPAYSENSYLGSTSPVSVNSQLTPYYEELNHENSTPLVDQQNSQIYTTPNVYPVKGPLNYDHCDTNGVSPINANCCVPTNMEPTFDYDALNAGITTYGDYDENYDDNSNLDDENDSQLACTVCRGRRMCFCYFLKVRYYKFPSFFDLVDHQYKKWRSTMVKAKKTN